MDTGMGMSMIWRQEQFLKNYNLIQQIGHHYDMDTTRVRHPK